MARRTISTTFQLSQDDLARLRLLAARTARTVDDCLQEAVALVLERHRERLPEQLSIAHDLPSGVAGPGSIAHDLPAGVAGPGSR